MAANTSMAERMYYVPRGEEGAMAEVIGIEAAKVVEEAGYSNLTAKGHIITNANLDAPHLGTVGDVMITLIPENAERRDFRKETLYLPYAEVYVYRQRNSASHNWRLLKSCVTIWTLSDNNALQGRDSEDLFDNVEEAIRWAAAELEMLF